MNRQWWFMGVGVVAFMVGLPGLAMAQTGAKDKVAAVVNGEKIPVSDVEVLLKAENPPVHPLTAAQKKEMWQMAMDMLINDALMRQFLAKNAPPVPAKEMDKELATIKEALNKKKVTWDQFLKETRQTEAQLRNEISSRIQWRAYVHRRLPDELVKKYYDDNKDFFDKVFVRASHILIKIGDKATDVEKKAAYDKLVQIRKDVLAGKIKFDDAAKQFSDCPSKAKGGDIGHFPYKFAVAEPFAKTAFAMKPNELSDLVATDFGYHIILVTERTKGEPSNFNNIKDFVRDVYAQDVQLFQSIINEQRQRSQIQVLETASGN